MLLKQLTNKTFYLINKNNYQILISVFISIILCLYYIFTNIPYENIIIYSFCILPFSVFYLFFVIDILKKLNFLRIIIYPIILFTLFLCMFMCLSISANDYAHLFFYLSVFLFPICFFITEIYAIIQDIKTFKNTTVPNDYNIYQNISSTVSIWKSRVSKVFGFFKSICQRIWNYFTEDIKK